MGGFTLRVCALVVLRVCLVFLFLFFSWPGCLYCLDLFLLRSLFSCFVLLCGVCVSRAASFVVVFSWYVCLPCLDLFFFTLFVFVF